MKAPTRRKPRNPRSQIAKARSRGDLGEVVRETTRLWRKHHLDYDQTKYVVEQVRRRLGLAPPATRPRTFERLDRAEVERLIVSAYRDDSQHGLLIKTLFLTGARVSEFVHIRVEDLHLNDDPPRIHLTHAKGQAKCRFRSGWAQLFRASGHHLSRCGAIRLVAASERGTPRPHSRPLLGDWLRR